MIKHFTATDENFMALFGCYKATIEPDITYRMFVSMYVSDELTGIDFTLFTDGDIRAGFSAAFFYATTMNEKPVYIIRSATGLQEDYQGKGVHDINDLYLKFIRFAARHPFVPKYMATYVINPLVFAQLCRFVPGVYPKPRVTVPEAIETIMDELVARSGHSRNPLHPYSVEVPIQVKFAPALLKRIYSSKDENIQWFASHVPFVSKKGLLTIVDISWINVWGTILHLSKYNIQKKQKNAQRSFNRQARRWKQKAGRLMQNIFQKRTL